MFLKSISYFFIATLSFSALSARPAFCDSQTSTIPSPAHYQSPLAEALAPFVKTLSSDVWVYHWGPRPDYAVTGIPAKGAVPMSVDMSSYIKLMVAHFEDTKVNQGSTFGNGLYAAADPITTRHYGGQDFGLLQITLPAGSRILHADFGITFHSDTTAFLYKYGCSNFLQSLFLVDGQCRRLLITALQELKIDAATYQYNVLNAKSCDSKSYLAFLIVGRGMIHAPTHFFVPEVPEGEPRSFERVFINTLVKQLGLSPIWTDLDLQGEPLQYTENLKEHILGCTDQYPEDRP